MKHFQCVRQLGRYVQRPDAVSCLVAGLLASSELEYATQEFIVAPLFLSLLQVVQFPC